MRQPILILSPFVWAPPRMQGAYNGRVHVIVPFMGHNNDTLSAWQQSYNGNAMHAVRTQCEVLDVDKYLNPSFGPFSQVFGSVPGFFFSFLSI